jgi:hypothetical protein
MSHGGDHEVVIDKIIISRKRGKLRIINVGNEYGYSYEAYCVMSMSNILSGQWHSLRKGSALKGKLLMVVNPQGTAISGFYSGKKSDGTDLLLGWVIARTTIDLNATARSLPVIVGFPRQAEDTNSIQKS